MYSWITTEAQVLGCIVMLYIGGLIIHSWTSCPLPPGPPGLPWFGNIIGIDTSAPWVTYSEWARIYGELIHHRLLGKDIVIINSEKVANDLLEKRSGNNSNRPYLIAAKLCGVDWGTAMLPYGNRWRLHRRFFHQTFRFDAVIRFMPYQHRRACDLLCRLITTPEKLNDHVFEYTTSVILNSVYDYDPPSPKDELFVVVKNVLNIAINAVRPDVAIMIGVIPLVLHLPSWLPGMSFKKDMEKARTYTKHYLDRPFEYSLQRKPTGGGVTSMMYDGLRLMERSESNRRSPDESCMQALKEASGTAFLAGSETSNAFLMTFFLLMMLNPAVQQKAQIQIDAVVGKARLPTIEDRPLLPYIDAIMWETARYSPVAPLSVAHAAVDEDVYNGFRIPKGAIILANLWSMAHDESRYPNPHVFFPERFLNDDGSLKPIDLEHIVFGFGRRMCVGRHFAEVSIWAVIVKVLAVFKILKPLDENGAEIQVEPKFSSGLVVHPLPFGCKIVPRIPGMDAHNLEELIGAS